MPRDKPITTSSKAKTWELSKAESLETSDLLNMNLSRDTYLNISDRSNMKSISSYKLYKPDEVKLNFKRSEPSKLYRGEVSVCPIGSSMSHHSDDQNLLSVTSDSFWEPGNYKRTTRRIDDGHRLCGELQALVQERADIEKTYAKSLKGWGKKWNDLIEKGPEYGTMEAAWKGALGEAERLCELHLRVKDSLNNDVITQIKNWQKDSFHKSMINQLKEKKEMDEAFKKAQKPWAKLLQKVERTKQDYHMACKQERTAQNQERNATGDSSISPDQVKKMAERVSKCRDDVARCRERYQAALAEIATFNPRYVEDMTAVFDRCQQMEAQRLTFFKDVLFSFHKCLNISQDPELPQIYEDFKNTVNNADHQKDLKWWANNHGVNMAMNWPQFEEYTEEFRDIAKGKSKESLPTAPITLLNQRPVSEDELPPITNNRTNSKVVVMQSESTTTTLNGSTNTNNGPTTNSIDKQSISGPISVHIDNLAIYAPIFSSSNGNLVLKSNSGVFCSKIPLTVPGCSSSYAENANFTVMDVTNPFASLINGTAPAPALPKSNKSSPEKSVGDKGADNPFDEDEWEEEGGALTDTGEPGVPVRALYDYTGAESDELTFKQGDLFEKLEDEDEQGWCKGRKDGRVGLYPANYVEPVGH